ncbi:MAG TPA: redoxin domain-containing protein [Actinomycetales bacterium]|nr:redoxin domain-containing protein [Actinomycetales bacterium]
MTSAVDLAGAAEGAWLEAFARGPRELTADTLVQVGDEAPDATLLDDEGRQQRLSAFWEDRPTLVVFWRHFGCSCGFERARRLTVEYQGLVDAGVGVVIVGMGDPSRAAEYRRAQRLPCRILCDPTENLYRRYGLVEWLPAQVLYDAPTEFLSHHRDTGEAFLVDRREQGRPPTDNPWRQTGEFLVGRDGRTRLALRYQYCEDYPDVRIVPAALAR